MNDDIIGCAEQVVRNTRLKTDMKKILENNSENIQDIVLIFVTADWEVDAYWTNLSPAKVRKVLTALDKGIR